MLVEVPQIISVEKCLRNHNFQDWLAGVNLMGRTEESVKDEFEARITQKKLTRTEKRVADNLLQNFGFVVPNGQMLGEEEDDWRDLTDRAKTNINRLRSKIEDNRQLIFNAHGLGYSTGVNRVSLTPSELICLFVLKQNRGKIIARDELAATVIGDDISAMRNLRTMLHHFRTGVLSDTPVRIETVRGVGLTLVEGGQKNDHTWN